MSDGVRGLIITHSSLGAGLAEAVRKITGVGDEALLAISNEGRGPAELLAEIQRLVGDDAAVIFTDMPGGSCGMAARRVAVHRVATAHVGGVNLPILLDFVFHREMPLHDLVQRLVDSGRAGITGMCTEETAHADHTAPH